MLPKEPDHVTHPGVGGALPAGGLTASPLWRQEGSRLYHLNRDRGLMVFDIGDVDHVKLLGCWPFYGDPVELLVDSGIVTAVLSGWVRAAGDGTLGSGAAVLNLDANDPAHIHVTAEAPLEGSVTGTHVRGNQLYTFANVPDGQAEALRVTSLRIAGPELSRVDAYDLPRSAAIVSATSTAIVIASEPPERLDAQSAGALEVRYIDISDPRGTLVARGSVSLEGTLRGSVGPDFVRLDFVDGQTAHLLSRAPEPGAFDISTIDFSDSDKPSIIGSLRALSSFGDTIARFDGDRLYLATSGGCSTSGSEPVVTPRTQLDIYGLSASANPSLLASSNLELKVSDLSPRGARLFALGAAYECEDQSLQEATVAYLDVSDPAQPTELATASWGLSSSPNFTGFAFDDAEGLLAVPWNDWNPTAGRWISHGLQLLSFTDQSLAVAGATKSQGTVERGVFMAGRLFALSDFALAVADCSMPKKPSLTNELLLRRTVKDLAATPADVAELSSVSRDGLDAYSELRIVPNVAAEIGRDTTLARVALEDEVFNVLRRGDLLYVLSRRYDQVECPPQVSGGCFDTVVQVQVFDNSSPGQLAPRGRAALPSGPDALMVPASSAMDAYDWQQGAPAVLVGDRLVIGRWSSDSAKPGPKEAFVVDVSDPDALRVDPLALGQGDGWWGNLRAIGDELYASEYEWIRKPSLDAALPDPGQVRYYLARLDLSDARHPRVSQKVNVPGLLVGSAADDASLLYMMDYQWDGSSTKGDFAVVRLDGERVTVQGHVAIEGVSGNVFVEGTVAYLSVLPSPAPGGVAELVRLDLSEPRAPVALPRLDDVRGWLKGVAGELAFVTSGSLGANLDLSAQGIDVFRLEPGQAPTYQQFLGIPVSSPLVVQAPQVLFAGGRRGTQTVQLP